MNERSTERGKIRLAGCAGNGQLVLELDCLRRETFGRKNFKISNGMEARSEEICRQDTTVGAVGYGEKE